MTVKIDKRLKLFYEFLEANNALIGWESNLLNSQAEQLKPMSRAEWFADRMDGYYNWISNAFLWCNTPEGIMYWNLLSNKWRTKLHALELHQLNGKIGINKNN